MKITKRVGLFFVAMILVLSVGFVSAQDNRATAFTAPENLTGIMVQEISSGAFVANDDGTYNLIINDASEVNAWAISQPAFEVAQYPTVEMASDWAFAEDLEVTATLALGEVFIELTLSNPAFDADTNVFSYTASINSTLGLEEGKDGLVMPETFSNGSLFVLLDASFVNDLINARIARFASARNISKNGCFYCNNSGGN